MLTMHLFRAGTALRVTFQVPPALSPHLEVLPKYGVIQGGSSYSAQLKFIPRASILGGSCQEFISESGEMVMPVEVQVVDQVRRISNTRFIYSHMYSACLYIPHMYSYSVTYL